jgi:hypothetical protein
VRKTVGVLAAIGAGVMVAWIAASRALSGEVLVTNWPSPEFIKHFANREENESATRVMATAERFGDDLAAARPALSDYIRFGKTPPPPILQKYANTIRTLRAQIVSNPAPVWPLQIDDILEPPAPPLTLHMRLFQLFGADAIAQHASGNNATAWADLHAAWILARSLWDRPETMSIATALAGSRMIAMIAAKLDPPSPPWWPDASTFDIRPPLLHSIEYEGWATRMRAERYPAGEPNGSRIDDTVRRMVSPFIRPIRLAQASITVGRMRVVAASVNKSDPCEPFVVAGMPEWSGFVRRFNRFRCPHSRITSR